MNNINYKVCNRCVMDTTDEDITFDIHGNCNHCTDFLITLEKYSYKPDKSEIELERIIDAIKKAGVGKEYDCIVGISGGVDSCYTAYLCKKFGLRVLLMHMDNGWDSEISVKNIKNVAHKLGFEYNSYVLNWNEFREIQLGFLKSSIVDLEMPTDIAIAASIYEVANKYNISYIISGGNFSAEGILPLTWGYHVLKDMKLYKHINSLYSSVKLKEVPTVGLLGDFYYKFIKKIKTIYLLNYVDFNKDTARKILIDELGWENYGGKHHESKITAFWQSYVMPTKFNMDYRKATYSSQICSNQITREEALSKLKECSYDSTKIQFDKAYVAKKYGISLDELEKYLNLPPKTYKDFPNNKKLITFLYDLYRRIITFKR